jgi:anti-sigma factor RsiW
MKTHDHDNPMIRLAGLADGELSGQERADAEAWVESDAAARDEYNAQRQFSPRGSFWSRVAPPEPSPAAWADALDRIRRGVGPVAEPLPVRPASGRRRAWAVSAIAAAVLFAVGALSLPRRGPGDRIPVASGEALPVVAHHEVEIVSVQGDGLDALVVGQPLLSGPLDIVTVGDTVLDVIVSDGGESPMTPQIPGSDPKKVTPGQPGNRTQPVP